jgi:hypothetical protein
MDAAMSERRIEFIEGLLFVLRLGLLLCHGSEQRAMQSDYASRGKKFNGIYEKDVKQFFC